MASSPLSGSTSKKPATTRVPTTYPHQVGGHGRILRLDHCTIMKPFTPREAAFYERINSRYLEQELRWLRDFTVPYHGRRITVFTDSAPDPVYRHLRWARGEKRSNGEVPSGKDDKSQPLADVTSAAAKKWPTVEEEDEKQRSTLVRSRTNPWAAFMASARPGEGGRQKVMLLLDDVCKDFMYPCVFDMKVGTRHYADDASPAKILSHTAKALATSTSAVGCRVIGFQSAKESHVLKSLDKYYGRRLGPEHLVSVLKFYFENVADNGEVVLRKDSIAIAIEKLATLAAHMSVQKEYNFYSSSLLIVYEGALDRPPRVEIRMIDFAHTCLAYGDVHPGYEHGLRNFLALLEAVREGRGGPLPQFGSDVEPYPYAERDIPSGLVLIDPSPNPMIVRTSLAAHAASSAAREALPNLAPRDSDDGQVKGKKVDISWEE